MEWETIQTNLKLFAEFDCMVAFNLDSKPGVLQAPLKVGGSIPQKVNHGCRNFELLVSCHGIHSITN